MDWGGDFFGLALLIAGGVLGVWAKKRKFDRTNQFGVERFSSFWGKVRVNIKDLLLIGSSIVLLSSGAILLASNHLDTWGWVVMAPVYLFMLYLFLGS